MGLDGGNWGQASALRGQAATQHANADIARSQGLAQKKSAYGRAARMEADNRVQGRVASDNLARLRGLQNKVQGEIRTQRGASGVTSEGSGMTAEISALSKFEQQAQDMAFSRNQQDLTARFAATMMRRKGDVAKMGADAGANYMDAQANMTSMQAHNADRAALVTGGLSVAGAVAGGFAGGGLGALIGYQMGQGAGSLYARGQVGAVGGNEDAERLLTQQIASWLA